MICTAAITVSIVVYSSASSGNFHYEFFLVRIEAHYSLTSSSFLSLFDFLETESNVLDDVRNCSGRKRNGDCNLDDNAALKKRRKVCKNCSNDNSLAKKKIGRAHV